MPWPGVAYIWPLKDPYLKDCHCVQTRTGSGRVVYIGDACEQMMVLAGFPATLEIGGKLENEFPISQSGKTQGIWGKHKEIREFVTVTQKGKVFASLGYVRLLPCVQVVFIDWLVIVAFVNITHLSRQWQLAVLEPLLDFPATSLKGKYFSWNFGTFSGKYQGRLSEFLFHKVLGTLYKASCDPCYTVFTLNYITCGFAKHLQDMTGKLCVQNLSSDN